MSEGIDLNVRTHLFAVPKEGIYQDSREEIAEAYRQMSEQDFDALLEFHPSYLEHQNTPDHARKLGKKGGLDLALTMFIGQRITGVRETNFPGLSGSYLFRILDTSNDPILHLPDLEVVSLMTYKLRPKHEAAIEEIAQFYEQHGWRTHTHRALIREREMITPKRFSGPIEIVQPAELQRIAQQHLDYDPERLAF
tara:strand:- start:3299 stop:3883 length:585 start_codon:yes stop_codon:yes gene_type:complete